MACVCVAKAYRTGSLDTPGNQVTIIIDEMKIKEELVYNGTTGEFVGYIDLGDDDLNKLVDRSKIATNILGIYVKGITNPAISYMVSYVPSDGFKANTLYHIVLKTISLLVNVSNLFPVAVIADGSQPNRSMFTMLASGVKHQSECQHPFDANRKLFFVSDPSHLVKTTRNNLLHSQDGQSKCLWNNGYLLWDPIVDLYMRDVEHVNKLTKLHKLTYKHVFPNNFERMRVTLAAQVLSDSVGTQLEKCGHVVFAKFIKLINKFFDICNSIKGSTHENKQEFRSNNPNDPRISWLKNEFIPYFLQWRENVNSRKKSDGSSFTSLEKSRMILSDSTFQGLLMTARSFLGILDYMFSLGAEYIMFRRVSQDVIESFFGQIRQKGGNNQNPNVSSFGAHMQMLNVTKTIKHSDSKYGNVNYMELN